MSPDNPIPVGDEALVRRLRDGDERAGNELAARHCAALMRYLQRLVRSDHLAEELHQQTWTSVLEHLDRFDLTSGGGGFKAWLYRIATNKAHDLWRARGREKVVKQNLTLITEEIAPDASHNLEGAEAEAKLRAAIELLPENQKQVLLLRYYGNLKFVEIAEMLGCPLNTALGRMHKAMIRLRELLAEPQNAESRVS
ncbi:MAG TPA: sigma-70 family RNA polymerase sigma factor [Tepidisphaeraceae bacterium]|nr:sigma-70 family RNA polymerase sigma factor [Tepidisphaeraceae bacterium]